MDCVLSGGDDYELLFTAPRERRREIDALSRELGVPLTRIGAIQSGQPRLAIVDAAGNAMAFRGGFDHFAQR
jgi:thiamine-monophosphate kinase